MIKQPYINFQQSLCSAVLPGIVELMAISMLIGFFNLLNSIFGVCFVIRNKIDVPKVKRGTRSIHSPKISKDKKSKKSMKTEESLLPLKAETTVESRINS